MTTYVPRLVIHGGAGTITPEKSTAEQRIIYHTALQQALKTGIDILRNGGSSIMAVEKAVMYMEDSELFNAGKGSVYASDDQHELEAATMCGKTLQFGGAVGLRRIKNPVHLAGKILSDHRFVLLNSAGAEEFAIMQGLELVENNYFNSPLRLKQLLKARECGQTILDHTEMDEKKYGTVGAVAMDSKGNLAAATSTGGLTNKLFRRIGDTPVPGSGTYANNLTAAVSCTGIGEYFLRVLAAYQVHARMQWANNGLVQACEAVIMDEIQNMGGEGGLIAINQKGEIAMPFNSKGMYRAWSVNLDFGKSALFSRGSTPETFKF
jgi:L-asparaginase / beta-aspartyl-peptidase